MEFIDLDLLFGGIVIILMALSFIGIVYIAIDDTGKNRIQTKHEKERPRQVK